MFIYCCTRFCTHLFREILILSKLEKWIFHFCLYISFGNFKTMRSSMVQKNRGGDYNRTRFHVVVKNKNIVI